MSSRVTQSSNVFDVQRRLATHRPFTVCQRRLRENKNWRRRKQMQVTPERANGDNCSRGEKWFSICALSYFATFQLCRDNKTKTIYGNKYDFMYALFYLFTTAIVIVERCPLSSWRCRRWWSLPLRFFSFISFTLSHQFVVFVRSFHFIVCIACHSSFWLSLDFPFYFVFFRSPILFSHRRTFVRDVGRNIWILFVFVALHLII